MFAPDCSALRATNFVVFFAAALARPFGTGTTDQPPGVTVFTASLAPFAATFFPALAATFLPTGGFLRRTALARC